MREQRIALIRYRLEQAEESLSSSKILLKQGMNRPAASRAYYAMFYAVMALLALAKERTSKHSGVVSLFDRNFVKKGIFDKELSRWFHEAFDLRQRADYREMFILTQDRASEALEHAVIFVKKIREQISVMIPSLENEK